MALVMLSTQVALSEPPEERHAGEQEGVVMQRLLREGYTVREISCSPAPIQVEDGRGKGSLCWARVAETPAFLRVHCPEDPPMAPCAVAEASQLGEPLPWRMR